MTPGVERHPISCTMPMIAVVRDFDVSSGGVLTSNVIVRELVRSVSIGDNC